MFIADLFELGWYAVAAVGFAIVAIGFLVIGILHQLFFNRRKGTETLFVKLLDKLNERVYLLMSDEEKECPEWASEELWRESIE